MPTVTKPIRPREVLSARINAHLHSARLTKQARSALDAFGQATLAMRISDGRLMWQTPLARKLLEEFAGTQDDIAPRGLRNWIEGAAAAAQTVATAAAVAHPQCAAAHRHAAQPALPRASG